MAESLGILIVFFFLLILGFSFYTKFAETQYEGKRLEGLQKKAVDAAQIIGFLPELKCSLGAAEEVIVTDVCIDKYKLESAQDIINNNKDYYYDILGFSEISVIQIYPTEPDDTEKTWVLYEKTTQEYSRKTRVYIPVSLYNTTAEIKLALTEIHSVYAFGYMKVDVYLK